MRRLILTLSSIALLCCAVLIGYLTLAPRGGETEMAQSSPSADSAPAPANAAPGFAVGATHTVDFEADEGMLAELTPRERLDQYRDWLLFTAIHAVQPAPQQFNDATFDLPAIRHGYMKPLGNFEFDETRSRLLDKDTVVAVIPKSGDAATKDHLAQIADEHRKNLGAMFTEMVVFEYELDAEHGSAVLTRRENIAPARLFSPEFGYYEQAVTNLADLTAFMAKVDDITMVSRQEKGLLLGGRKIAGRHYRGVTPEQVATVWQAEHKIQQVLDKWQRHADEAVAQFNLAWGMRTYRGSIERARLETERDAEWELLKERLRKEREDLHTPGGSGFSLDPTYDFAGLKTAFLRVADRINREWDQGKPLITAEEVSQIGDTLTDDKEMPEARVVPLLRLVERLKQRAGDDPAVAYFLESVIREFRYQAARYDGDLKGTEVGMVLFYTDLLAKLWTIDFQNSAPIDQVKGFMSGTRVPLSSIYEEEAKELPSARLWFGHSNLGFQIADAGSTMFLARVATRIYAAGSNPLDPGREVQTSQLFAAALEWWNDHYAEVAAFEQEYERLNEIMKWSIVIGWLNEANQGQQLGFLEDVAVDRSKRLPDWVSHHPELRFQGWDKIGFYPPGYKGSTTEAIPIKQGPSFERNGAVHYLSGGVSLAPKTIFKDRAAISSLIGKERLRSNLDYAKSASDALKTFDGTAFKVNAGNGGRFSVMAQAKASGKLRGTTGQLVNAEVERTTVATTGSFRLETRVAGARIGDLDIETTANGFRIGWQARELDRAHTLGRQLSTASDPVQVLRTDPNVETVIELPGRDDYLVKLTDSDRWVRFAPEESPTADIGQGWQMRTAATKGADLNFQLAVIDPSDAAGLLKGGHLVADGGDNGGKVVFRLSTDQPPPGTRLVTVKEGDFTVQAWVDRDANAVHLLFPEKPGAAPLSLAPRLDTEELAAIRAIEKDAARPAVVDLQRGLGEEVVADLESGNFRRAVDAMSSDPAGARAAIDRRIGSEISRNRQIAEADGPVTAIHHLDRLIRAYGPVPDVVLRRALLQIERGNIEAAVESAAFRPSRGFYDRTRLFDDINHRIAAIKERPLAEQQDLYRFAEYADWVSRLNPGGARDLGGLSPVVDGGHFDFDFQLSGLPSARPALIDSGAVAGAPHQAWRQVSPALNNVDWSAPLDQALRQVTAGKLASVIHLPRGDIAHFHPREIYVGDHSIQFHEVGGAHGGGFHLPANGYQSCNTLTDLCSGDSTDQKNSRKDEDIVLIVAN